MNSPETKKCCDSRTLSVVTAVVCAVGMWVKSIPAS